MVEPFYQDNHNTLYCMDFRKNDLPDECVQEVCTSPPYWGLRKYSGEQELIWGGDKDCQHQWGTQLKDTRHDHTWATSSPVENRPPTEYEQVIKGQYCGTCGAWRGAYGLEPTPEMYVQHTIEILREIRRVLRKDGVVFLNLGDSYASGGKQPNQSPENVPAYGNDGKGFLSWKECDCACPCHDGERQGFQLSHIVHNDQQLDIETLPCDTKAHDKQPVDSSLGVVDGVPLSSQESNKHVSSQVSLANPSVLFCSDCLKFHYLASDTSNPLGTLYHIPELKSTNLKPKDLCLIPFRVAIAAQEDGWWVRSVIIWSKNNPMPESVTDRPTESHEYILMLTKSGTTQYWTHPRKRGSRVKPKADYIWTHKRSGLVVDYQPVSDRILREFWRRSNLWRGHDYYWDADAVREPQTGNAHSRGTENGNQAYQSARGSYKNFKSPVVDLPAGRNIRSVWEFPTQPYPEAHFAVFPEKLPEICIKAATPEVGCCSKCGAPWERIVERQNLSTYEEIKRETGKDYHDSIKLTELRGVALSGGQKSVGNTLTPDGKVPWYNKPDNKTLGWQPTCKCNADKVPSICLDPFMGAGTTLWVAKKLGRKAIGFDTSEEYCQLTVERIRQQVLL